jgi:glycosyltransferase involved in cell wall biosynthesis
MTEASSLRELAIVIPAYKTKFLRESLQSIVSQTDQNFQLYIGDDCSPEPVVDIVQEFSKKLSLKYHRFDRNLGGTSLVKQWERCVRLSEEPWVWLFSDDDTMEPGCVAAFLAELEKTRGQHDLYRFNTIWVNSNKNTSEENPPYPTEETGVDFLHAKLHNTRRSTLQELIFSRQAWEACGGIPDFPLAWASDDAFIAKLGTHRSIRTIAGPRVVWRWSNMNITSDNSAPKLRAKLKASEEFVRWVIDYFEGQMPKGQRPDRAEILRLTENWFFAFVDYTWRFMDLQSSRQIEKLAADVWGHPKYYGFCKTQKFNLRHLKRKSSEKIKRLLNVHS